MGSNSSCPVTPCRYNCFRDGFRKEECSSETSLSKCTANKNSISSAIMYLYQFPQIRGQIWRYLDGSSVLAVRQTCKLFRDDVDSSCLFCGVCLDDRISENMSFMKKIEKIRSLIVNNCTNISLLAVVKNPENIRNVCVEGMMSQVNFHELISRCSNLEDIKINLSSNYSFLSTREFSIEVPCLKTLELYADREFQPRIRGRDSLLKTLILSQASIATILNGMRTPRLERMVCQVSFFDVEREELAVEYGDMILNWIKDNLLSLRDFRFTLSWKPEGSFVESLVALRGNDQLMTFTAEQIGIINDEYPESTDMDSPDCLGSQFEYLKLIWDFLTPAQADQWKILIVKQRKLKYLTCGFVQPIKWQTFRLPIHRSSQSLIFVALHNLAVYTGREFCPVDLSLFANCKNLKALHLSLSVFQEPVLPGGLYNSPHLVHTMSLPKGLVQLTLTRFTIGTEQLLAMVAGLPNLKILAMSFLGRDAPDVGLTSDAVIVIWGLQKLKNMWVKDFLNYMEPIITDISKYFIATKDLDAAMQLSDLLAKAKDEAECFGFHLVNSNVSPKNSSVEPLVF